MKSLKIYIAGPFFNKVERTRLEEFIGKVKIQFNEVAESMGVPVEYYVPMEHFIKDGENMPNDEWAFKVFEADKTAIEQCDIMVAMYTGMYSDTGTSWEIGYAYGLDKPCGVYIPDEFKDQPMNLMIVNGCDRVVTFGKEFNLSELIQK